MEASCGIRVGVCQGWYGGGSSSGAGGGVVMVVLVGDGEREVKEASSLPSS